VDFEGPNSALSKRHGLIRYERKYGNNSIAGISLESPGTDYYNPADTLIENKNKQGSFDIAGRYKYLNRYGHFQVAGIFRRIEYLNLDKMNTLFGWGILISTNIKIDEKNLLFGQYSFGQGIANYYVGFENNQLDAVHNPESGTMELKTIRGGFATYTFLINPAWMFSVTAGTSYIKCFDFEPSDSFKSSKYFASNIFYDPIETIRLGFELTTGSRTNFDDQKGRSTRISFIANFAF
jgi:hypothetical protein